MPAWRIRNTSQQLPFHSLGDTPIRPSRSVLVVDDDDDLRSVIGLVLERAGYTVLLASDGRVALEMLRETPAPGAILLDLSMPEMSGYEVVQHLRTTPELSAVPLILMTAANERDRGDLPAVAAIRKPIEQHELLFIVEKAFQDTEPPAEPPR